MAHLSPCIPGRSRSIAGCNSDSRYEVVGIPDRQPLITVLLQCIDGFVTRLPQRYADELFGDGSVEPFDRSVRLGCSDRHESRSNVIESEIEFVRMGFSATELCTVIREDDLDRESAARYRGSPSL